MGIPLRGELTAPIAADPSHESDDQEHGDMQAILHQLLRISAGKGGNANDQASFGDPNAAIPSIAFSSAQSTSRDRDTRSDVPWSFSPSETRATRLSILPYLIHLAASKNDVEGIRFCIDAADEALATVVSPPAETDTSGSIANPFNTQHLSSRIGGVGVSAGTVNMLDTSGKAPLHTAALHGSINCAKFLLESGASVHIRDALDHTPLYYVSTSIGSYHHLSHITNRVSDP
jgi:60kDa lysophospholipase